MAGGLSLYLHRYYLGWGREFQSPSLRRPTVFQCPEQTGQEKRNDVREKKGLGVGHTGGAMGLSRQILVKFHIPTVGNLPAPLG